MKIYIANYQPDKLGGGWSFARNFNDAMGEAISDYVSSDIYFITSPSMVQREDVLQAKNDGKKIVLRIDNIVRNSRNRNTGMTRMKDFAEWADLVVYQSVAARNMLMPFLQKSGPVILNATNENIFKGSNVGAGYSYLYSRFNRDETKNFEVARSYFSKISLMEPKSKLTFVGQFSPELVEGNFDFYNNENYHFFGTVNNPNTMAEVYRNNQYLIYSYWNDACSNTLIEALMCGCMVIFPDTYYKQGSANEIMTFFEHYGEYYFHLARMANEYREAMSKL